MTLIWTFLFTGSPITFAWWWIAAPIAYISLEAVDFKQPVDHVDEAEHPLIFSVTALDMSASLASSSPNGNGTTLRRLNNAGSSPADEASDVIQLNA